MKKAVQTRLACVFFWGNNGHLVLTYDQKLPTQVKISCRFASNYVQYSTNAYLIG